MKAHAQACSGSRSAAPQRTALQANSLLARHPLCPSMAAAAQQHRAAPIKALASSDKPASCQQPQQQQQQQPQHAPFRCLHHAASLRHAVVCGAGGWGRPAFQASLRGVSTGRRPAVPLLPTCASNSSGGGGSSTTTTEGRVTTTSTSSSSSSAGSGSNPAGSPALARAHHSSDKSVAASATAVSASLWSHDEEEEEHAATSAAAGHEAREHAVGATTQQMAATAAATTTAAAAAAARVVDAMQQQIDAWAASATTQQKPAQQQQQQQAQGQAAGTAAASSAAGEEGLGWRRRWTIVLLCFFAFILCNMDRVNMAVAILPMSAQYGWQPATQGMIQSAFFWGYLCTQILGGVWAAKFGGKLVLGLGVAWWSVATAITPFAAQAGLPVLMVARALMGIGEGVAMPAMNQLLSKWVPSTERSRSLSLVYSGMFLGSMIGLTMSPQVINAFGWPSVFVSFGSLGLVWLAAWVAMAAASPSNDPKCSPAERAFIAANSAAGAVDLHAGAHSTHGTTSSTTKAAGGSKAAAAEALHVEPAAAVAADRPINTDGADAAAGDIPWGLLLSRKEVWAIILSHFCHNWGTFILLTWMPSYYSQVLGLDLASSGTLSCLPWATMAVSANVGGWLADAAIARGATITTVRKVMQTIGFLGPAFFLGQLSHVDGVLGAVVCMMGAQGCDAFSQSGLYSNHQDIAPRYAGVLLGLSNTAGVFAGVLGSLVTGFILQHGTWDQVWQVAIALYLAGTCIWNAWATGERVID